MGNLQPLTLPDTLDPLVVDDPARLAQELAVLTEVTDPEKFKAFWTPVI
jgi:hypothetical protein